MFHLNEQEVEAIRGLLPKREMYLRRSDEFAVLRLEVDRQSYWLYTSSAVDAEKRSQAVEAARPGARHRAFSPRGFNDPRHHRLCIPDHSASLSFAWPLRPTTRPRRQPQTRPAAQSAWRASRPGRSRTRSCRSPDQDPSHHGPGPAPKGENILDFIVGDSDYWHLTGAANLAYLKPLDEKVQTNVALVCETGAIYSFLVKEAPDPHLVVRIEAARATGAPGRPAFCRPVRGIEDYREMARAAGEAARAAREAADLRSDQADSRAAEAVKPVQGRLPRAAVLRLQARQEGSGLALPG